MRAVMNELETNFEAPFTITEHGTIRIAGSRVSLDMVIHPYKLGATAEQIAYCFLSLSLADIYPAIAYHLTHREEVEEYLRRQEAVADALLQQIESDPKRRQRITELRERILARRRNQHEPTLH